MVRIFFRVTEPCDASPSQHAVIGPVRLLSHIFIARSWPQTNAIICKDDACGEGKSGLQRQDTYMKCLLQKLQ